MKTLSYIREQKKQIREGLIPNQLISANPGNGLGLSNKYTPVSNIIMTLRNFFGSQYGLVIREYGSAGIKITCSRWGSYEQANNDIYNSKVSNEYLFDYLQKVGLGAQKLFQDGYGEFIFIATAPDVKDSETPCPCDACCHEDEIVAYYGQVANEGFNEEELKDKTPEEIYDIISSDNKIKAAERFADLINTQMNLPPDYYFKAVKDSDGNESIALRHKTEKRRPFGKKAEIVTSLMNIYGPGEEAIWIDGYDDPDSMDDMTKTLIDNILNFIQAEKTTDVCVYSMKNPKEKDEDENKEDNNDEDEDKKDDGKEEENKDEQNKDGGDVPPTKDDKDKK